MGQINCTISSEFSKNTAEELGLSDAEIVNAIAELQTEFSTSEIPSTNEIKEFFNRRNSPIDSTRILINKESNILKINAAFTPKQRKDRVDFIAKLFSNEVSKALNILIENAQTSLDSLPEDASAEDVVIKTQYLEELKGPKGRHRAIQITTIRVLINKIQEQLEELRDSYTQEIPENRYYIQQYQNILDNLDFLFQEASFKINNNEDILISFEKQFINKATESTEVLGGNVSEDPTLENNENEDTIISNNAGWGYQIKFVDPHRTISKATKKILSNLLNIDPITKKPLLDDLGHVKYLNEEYAHAVLLDKLSSMIDDTDFCTKQTDVDGTIYYDFPILNKLVPEYPWVQQIINELVYNSTETSLFFADFRKDFISYWKSQFKDNSLKQIPLNRPSGQSTARQEMFDNYNSGTPVDNNPVYSASGTLIQDNILLGTQLLSSKNINLQELYTAEDNQRLYTNLAKTIRMLGLNVSSDSIQFLHTKDNGLQNITSLLQALRTIYKDALTQDKDSRIHLLEKHNQNVNLITKLLGETTQLSTVSSFRLGDKTYQSYSAPNYLTTQIKILKNDARRQAYLDNEFKKSPWFYNKTKNIWNHKWLEIIESDSSVRNNIEIKELLAIDDIPYDKWNDKLIKERFVSEYFAAGYNTGATTQYAWYNYPIFADSTAAVFIKFIRYTDNYEEILTENFKKVVYQELERIKLVKNRETLISEGKISPIQSYDSKQGKQFCFLPFLNTYVDAQGMTFIDRVTQYVQAKNLKELDFFIHSVIKEQLTNEALDFSKDTSLQKSLQDYNIATSKEEAIEKLKEYYWNSKFATSQIIQLTVTDIAFSKDQDDFQKRFKEVYAAGIKLNTQSQYGKDFENTIYIKDLKITSFSYNTIKAVLSQLEKTTKIPIKSILEKFRDINATDAQAYRSLSSYRAVLDMMGLWDTTMEDCFNRFDQGIFSPKDTAIIWNTFKPFMFTNTLKDDGFGNKIRVPHQNKNSEFLLLAMYSIVANGLDKSGTLKAINTFMEQNDIDVVQFNSAVKSGCQGSIDLNYSNDKLQDWVKRNPMEYKEIQKIANTKTGYEQFKTGNDLLLDLGKITQEEYNIRMQYIQPSEKEVLNILKKYALQEDGTHNTQVVHSLSYKDYMIPQPSTGHLFDTTAVMGSQFRNLLVSDLPEDFSVTLQGKKFDKQELLNLYNSIINENLIEGFERVKEDFKDIDTLSKKLLTMCQGNPKYDRTLIEALQLEEYKDAAGNIKKRFIMPMYTPTIIDQISDLTTSMFKNAVTNQKINGAQCVLVSNFGFTNDLHINFNKDLGILDVECYMPWYTKKYFEPFLVTKNKGVGKNTYQEIDIEKIKKVAPELLKGIGYRIPTEDKYSMVNFIIKGFLPQQNGGAIMLPAEYTTIAGWDFDVDKLYMMLPSFSISNQYDMKEAMLAFYKDNKDVFEAIEQSKKLNFQRSIQETLSENPQLTEEQLNTEEIFKQFVSTQKELDWVEGADLRFKKWFNKNKKHYIVASKIHKIQYDINKTPEDQGVYGLEARNNMLLDISYAILSHPSTAQKILNPGSFDNVHKAALKNTILTDKNLLSLYIEDKKLYTIDNKIDYTKVIQTLKKDSLQSLSTFIKDYKEVKDPLTINTFVFYHRQNMVGKALIGQYANNTTLQAKFQDTGLTLKPEYTINIDNKELNYLDQQTSDWGERISKNCAEFSAASVDNAKTPTLAELMQNEKTANITALMLRIGMPINLIGLLFIQPKIKSIIEEEGELQSILKLKTPKSLQNIILTEDILIENIINNTLSRGFNEVVDDNILTVMQRIVKAARDLGSINSISRADSSNAAIDITLGGAKNQTLKVAKLDKRRSFDTFSIGGMKDILKNINTDNVETYKEQTKEIEMPRLQAFYSLGIEMPLQVLSKYFLQLQQPLNDQLLNLLNDADGWAVSDDIIQSFYREYVEYMLTSSTLFGTDVSRGQTFDQKRNYYLYEFPSKFLEQRLSPKFKEFTIINKILVKQGVLEFSGSVKSKSGAKEIYITDFESMITSEDLEVQQMAIDLFMYNFYKTGMNFGPNSFGRFFSPTFVKNFTEYIDTLNDISTKVNTMSFSNFMAQFYNNHYKDFIKDVTKEALLLEKDNNSTIIVPLKKVINPYSTRYYDESIPKYEFVQYKEKLYQLDKTSRDYCSYNIASTFTDAQGKKYNAAETVEQMMENMTPQELIEANSKVGIQPSVESAAEEALDALEEAFEDIDEVDLFYNKPKFDLETAAKQLELPLCNSKN